MYSFSSGTIFVAIVYPTANSFIHYKNFFDTFMLGDNTEDLEKCVGEWGSVEIKTSDFGDREFSVVKFVYQPLPIRIEAWRISVSEKEKDTNFEP